MSNRKVYINCACETPDHLLVCSLDVYPDEEPEIWFQPLLNYRYPWYKRVWVGLQYMFNRTMPVHWHFDTLLLTEEQVNELASLIVHYRLVQKVRRKKMTENGRNLAG